MREGIPMRDRSLDCAEGKAVNSNVPVGSREPELYQ